MRASTAAAKLLAVALVALCALAVLPSARTELATVAQDDLTLPADGSRGCVACHAGIERMHPQATLSCVDCHGGDAKAKTKADAHVRAAREYDDERVAPLDEDLAWRRFVNPMDLRVAREACGRCHADVVEHVKLSLHGTTAGHLSDGYYEAGINPRKQPTWSVFTVEAPKHASESDPNALDVLYQVPAFKDDAPEKELATHYADLARKECMQCHLWSEGRAVRGRVGFDGDYRGEGCAACHVPYALDGLSDGADAKAIHGEPGHPRTHTMTRAPTTQTCTSCHYGDATIGLNFRGLSQLPPGAPGGPEIAGTTDRLLNRQFYVKDAALNPPDVHHERGMHCIDCHTANDVMGDGRLVGAMEHAVEISCSDCHGTFTAPSTLKTQRGTPLEHLRRDGDRVILKSKVDGKEHDVKQLVRVLDASKPEFNARAAAAMTSAHANVECYTCHASWNANFLGFHFDRNESLTQLDLLSGKRTPGRVTTQEKVFATWKSFYAGRDERGAVAPYLTGFSTMGSVTNAKGERVLDQVMPVTKAGLSGVTMIHHQMHSVRKSARSCVECHRSSTTWGLGSPNFRLTRQIAFVADRRGIEAVALDRARLSGSQPLAKIVLPDVTALELQCDPLQGRAEVLYAAEGQRGVHVIDVRDPTRPERIGLVESVAPQELALRGTRLYAADGPGGLAVFDVAEPKAIRRVARVPMCDARALDVRWPWAYVADGPAGLVIVDVRAPEAPRNLAGLLPRTVRGDVRALADVAAMFQYSRPLASDPNAPTDERSPARMLVALLDAVQGLVLVDATEPEHPTQLYPQVDRRGPGVTDVERRIEYKSLVLQSHVDLAQRSGGQRTTERDYAYVLEEHQEGTLYVAYVSSIDVTDPVHPKRVGRVRLLGSAETITPIALYNAPFLQTELLVAGYDGVSVCDATISTQLNLGGALPGIRAAYAIAAETFPLDRVLDEANRPTKDVSHASSRWMELPEIERILSVRGEKPGELGAPDPKTDVTAPPTWTARLAFARADADGNAFLEKDELDAKRAKLADRNDDGRVSLAEFSAQAGVVPEASVDGGVVPYAGGRSGLDGDLARLFDGLDPYAYDKDADGKLARADVERMLFATLDLDKDGKLSRAEASRAPGELRQLRYGGVRADQLFQAYDGDHTGFLEAREVRLRDEEWSALDANKDGGVQLVAKRGARSSRRGGETDTVEWPSRITYPSFLPPDVTVERLLATFDEDKDGALNKRELRARPDVAVDMDDDGDGIVKPNELKGHVDQIAIRGVDSTPDAFLARWDLNGDGKVEPKELALPRWIQERLGIAPK